MKSFSTQIFLSAALCGIMLSATVGWYSYQFETKSIQLIFKNDVDDKVASIERELLINLDALYALKGLFDNSVDVSNQEFTNYAKALIDRHDNIQALEWAPKIPHHQRDKFLIENQHHLGGNAFEITERVAQGHMIKAQERAQYYPIYFIEPLIGNELALGFDLASNNTRKTTLTQAADSGNPVATASILLVQELSQEKGFLIFFPVYDGIANTQSQRQEKIKGFIIGAFRLADIFRTALKRTLAKGFTVKLLDSTTGKDEFLYEGNLSQYDPLSDIAQFSYSKNLNPFYGRSWRVVATPSAQYIDQHRSSLPYIAGFGCLFIILLGLFYNYVLTLRNSELHLATKRLAQLCETDVMTGIPNRRFFERRIQMEWQRAIREHTNIAILMIDVDSFKLFNDVFGHLRGDKCLTEIAQVIGKFAARATDFACRFGGEEFVLVLPNTEHGEYIAEQCRLAVEQLQIPQGELATTKYVTVSIGVAAISPQKNSDFTELLCHADKALYLAKDKGKNCVHVL